VQRAAYNETMPFRRLALSLLAVCLMCAATSPASRAAPDPAPGNSKPLQTADLPTCWPPSGSNTTPSRTSALPSTWCRPWQHREEPHHGIQGRPRLYPLPQAVRYPPHRIDAVVRSTMFDMFPTAPIQALHPVQGPFHRRTERHRELSPNKMEISVPTHSSMPSSCSRSISRPTSPLGELHR